MRTRSAHILPGCPYCDSNHDPDIRCRLEPESTRFQLSAQPPTRRREVRVIRDHTGQIIATTYTTGAQQ